MDVLLWPGPYEAPSLILFDLITSLSLISTSSPVILDGKVCSVRSRSIFSSTLNCSNGSYPTHCEVKKNKKRLSRAERSNFIIETPLNEIIVGLLLGDGHIQKRYINGNSRFMYSQSSLRVHHLNYFNHILDLFRPYLSKEFKLKDRSFTDKKTNKIYRSVSFATLALPCFNDYRNLFYNSNNLKIVPSNISNLLSPRGLAYWIMDDGSLQNKGLHLNTYGFKIEDVLILKQTLENMFGESSLNCSIHKHQKGHRIYIWEESMVQVRNNISKYMHKDMLYKIN